MLNKLPPRERQIMNLLYERGEMAVAAICDSLPDQPSASAIRTMLKRLEAKGFVARAEFGSRLSLSSGRRRHRRAQDRA